MPAGDHNERYRDVHVRQATELLDDERGQELTASERMAAAQAHATLALVYQLQTTIWVRQPH